MLGGGITGLTAAWELQRAGFLPVVFEKSPRTGGVIGATHMAGWLHEGGPNSLLDSEARLTGFLDDLGLGPRRLPAAPDAKRRYIVRGGRLVAMPASPPAFLASGLFSWRAKFNLLGEPWRRRGAPGGGESVAGFVERRLGREFLDYAVDPLVGGIYAGDPARLSLRHAFPKLHALEQEHGSLLRAAWRRRNATGGPRGRIFSFPNGLEEIPEALTRALGRAVRCGCAVRWIRPCDTGWLVSYDDGGEFRAEIFSAVVCALPAAAMAALPFEPGPAADHLTTLRGIEHPPVVSVFLGYRREQVNHPLDGFGFLVPTVERRQILGTLFSSTLFPGRAPAGHIGLTTFVGGSRAPGLAQLDDSGLVQLVESELRSLLGVDGSPAYFHVQRWPRAIPQYTLGYERVHEAIAAAEELSPGLFIGGNCRDGVALSQCILSGRRLAAAAGAWIRRQ